MWTHHPSPYHFGSKPQEWCIVASSPLLSTHWVESLVTLPAKGPQGEKVDCYMAIQKVASRAPTLIPTTWQSVSASHTLYIPCHFLHKSQRGQGVWGHSSQGYQISKEMEKLES